MGLAVPDTPESASKLEIKPDSVLFEGKSLKGVHYAVTLPLYDAIDPEASKKHHTMRGVDLVLRKKELRAEYWPRLLKEKQKVHFVKTDFDKWVDEDEQDGTADDDGLGGLDLGAMGGDGGGLGGLDFSQLGAMGGGDGDEGEAGGEGDQEEEEDLPELEGEDKKEETK